MRKSVIFNSDQIKGLQSGNITAFVVKNPQGMTKKHAPYQISQEIFVKEKWGEMYDTCDHPELSGNPTERWSLGYLYGTDKVEYKDGQLYVNDKWEMAFTDYWKSAVHMPESAARFRLKITGVKVVRVQDMDLTQIERLSGFSFTPNLLFLSYITDKYGRDFWDANSYMWYYTFELIKL